MTTTENLTFAQAAERLGVGVLTIRAWVRHDRCPVVRDRRKASQPIRSRCIGGALLVENTLAI